MLIAAALGAVLGALVGLLLGLGIALGSRDGIWPDAWALLGFAGAGIGALVPILEGVL